MERSSVTAVNRSITVGETRTDFFPFPALLVDVHYVFEKFAEAHPLRIRHGGEACDHLRLYYRNALGGWPRRSAVISIHFRDPVLD
jgi:hypothetical protein